MVNSTFYSTASEFYCCFLKSVVYVLVDNIGKCVYSETFKKDESFFDSTRSFVIAKIVYNDKLESEYVFICSVCIVVCGFVACNFV